MLLRLAELLIDQQSADVVGEGLRRPVVDRVVHDDTEREHLAVTIEDVARQGLHAVEGAGLGGDLASISRGREAFLHRLVDARKRKGIDELLAARGVVGMLQDGGELPRGNSTSAAETAAVGDDTSAGLDAYALEIRDGRFAAVVEGALTIQRGPRALEQLLGAESL